MILQVSLNVQKSYAESMCHRAADTYRLSSDSKPINTVTRGNCYIERETRLSSSSMHSSRRSFRPRYR